MLNRFTVAESPTVVQVARDVALAPPRVCVPPCAGLTPPVPLVPLPPGGPPAPPGVKMATLTLT
jgi:hypothetical protein